MKTLLLFFSRLVLLLPVGLLIIFLNFVVDPSHLFDGGEFERKTIALLRAGKSTEGRENRNERRFQKFWVHTLGIPTELVTFGSSRALPIGQRAVGKEDYFNSAVSGATLWDLIGVYELYRAQHLLPKKILLECSEWILNGSYDDPKWFDVEPQVREALQRMSLPYSEGYFLVSPLTRLRLTELFSLRYFQSSLQRLRRGARFDGWELVWPGMDPRVVTELSVSGGTTPDGSLHWPKWMREDRARVQHLARLRYEQNAGHYHRAFDSLDPKLTELFVRLVQSMKEDDVEVSLLLTPYHPLTYNDYMGKPLGARLKEAEAFFREVARENSLPIFGSYSPTQVGVAERSFVDGLHITQAGLVEVLRDYRERSSSVR